MSVRSASIPGRTSPMVPASRRRALLDRRGRERILREHAGRLGVHAGGGKV
jgi:hypothetical protein